MMRKRFAFLGVLALVFALFPSVALAFDVWPNGSYWAGVPNDEPGYYAAFVRADNRYEAAVYGLGFDPASLSAEVKLKLSDPVYGGHFYKYAMTFENVSGWDDMPEWLPTYVMMGAIGLGQSFERIYASKATNALRFAALGDYETVFGGGGAGHSFDGGEVEPDLSNGVTFDFAYSSGNYYKSKKVGDNFRNYSGTTKVNLSADVYASLSGYSYLVFGFYTTGGTGVTPDSANVYGFAFGSNSPNLSITHNTSSRVSISNGVGFKTDWRAGISFSSLSSFTFSMGGGSSSSTMEGWHMWVSALPMSSIVPSPPSPDGDWPEPESPATPTGPEVPTPTAPTETVDPDPTAPTITWPTAPTLVLPTAPIVSTTPEGIDYTALLTLINDNLNSIDAYLQNFYTSFNSFRSDFLNGVDDIVDGLRNIYQYLGHLNNILEVHCKHITDQIEESVYNLELYLKRLFEWLPRQLDFDAEYDDSAVTALLRRILNKIPGGSTGPVTYKPNPQSDEPSFWDWLADLFNRILQKLLDLLPDEMIQLGQLFGELINLFPFSIPWDLFALLALFGHEPVTPVIDIPWGYGGSDGQVMMIRIDLHAWDGVAEMVRPVFLVLFCLQLALLSRDLLKIINVKSGGE